MISMRVCAIVDVEMVIAVKGQLLEAKHKLLQNGIGLERDRTVEVVLRLAADHRAIDLLVQRMDPFAET